MEHYQLIRHGTKVIIGVSGGADSLLLLKYYTMLREEWHLEIIAVSIDHGLRGQESAQDVQFVAELCKKWGVTFVGRQVDVNQRKQMEKEGTQQAARILRYQVFEEVMRSYQADFLALAHHGDDQAETVLMRLIRQSNPASLTGIPIKRPFACGYLIRPFLTLSKPEIYHYCDVYQIVAREDPSNQSSTYMRNFLRNQVMPLLKQREPQLHIRIQAMTERLTEDQDYLMAQTEKMLAETTTFSYPIVFFQIEAFQTYPMALQRRAFHLILNYLYHVLPANLHVQHEKDFFELLRNTRSNVTIDFPNRLKVTKSYDVIRFHFLSTQKRDGEDHRLIHIPDTIPLTDGAFLQAAYTSVDIKEDKHTLQIPVALTSFFPLTIRTREPGDRIRVRGLDGSKKVKDIFIDEKIPLEDRGKWPIVVGADGTLLWIIGLRKAEIDKQLKQEKYVVLNYIETNNRRHHDA
nr:tRNA lysidine(34) synthetase TilS [Gracilibacillus alcaliphilus]